MIIPSANWQISSHMQHRVCQIYLRGISLHIHIWEYQHEQTVEKNPRVQSIMQTAVATGGNSRQKLLGSVWQQETQIIQIRIWFF
jgi:hypothetical protein